MLSLESGEKMLMSRIHHHCILAMHGQKGEGAAVAEVFARKKVVKLLPKHQR